MPRIILLFFALLPGLMSNAGIQVKIRPEPSWISSAILDPSPNSNPKNVSNGYYYDLIDRQVNLDVQTIYQHIIRHIVNESGVQEASEVSVTFSPQYQQVAFHKIVIIRDGRVINQLETSSIKTADEESDASSYLYNGTRRAYVILKNVQKGDQIEFSYSVTGFNPVFQGFYSGEFYFYNSTPALNFHLSFLTGTGRKLNFKLFNGAVAPSEEKSGSQILYQWKNPVIDNASAGSDIPGWYTISPYVTVSEFRDWKQVNDWGLGIFNNYQFSLPEKLLQKMAGWKKMSGGDPDMFANLALRYIQDQVRYLGLEIGSNTHQPHPPGMVFSQGFGDCKDKALLLTSILKHENIDAYVALVNTQEKEHLSEIAPSTLAFNHAIVALRRGKSFVFIDPTRSLQRGELINNYIPAYGWALVVQPGGDALSPIEPGFLNYTYVVEDLTVSLTDTSLFRVTTTYKGGAADDTRNSLSETSMKDLEEGYMNYYKKLFDGIEAASAISIEDDSLKNEIKILEFYKIPKVWEKNNEGQKEVGTYAKLIALKFPDPVDHKAKDPVSLDFPFTMDYTLRMTMPDDWPLSIAEVHIKNESYQFDFTPIGNGKHLLFKYYLKTFRDHIPAQDFAQYKADYKDVAGSLSLSFTSGDLMAPPARQKNFRPEGDINWIAIWATLFAGVLMTMLFNFLNRRSVTDDSYTGHALPLHGAVIFLGITLGLRFLYQGFVFLGQHYYQLSVWNQLGAGGTSLQIILVAEMIASLFSMCGSLTLLYWFFKKRDIFPNMFVRYVVIVLIAQFLLLLVYLSLNVSLDLTAVKKEGFTQLIRSAVYAAIWISFILKSERVKQTFIYPYQV